MELDDVKVRTVSDLNDDTAPTGAQFDNSKLSLGDEPAVGFAGSGGRPHSASQRSQASTGSRSSLKNADKQLSNYVSKGFFCVKKGYFETAVDACKNQIKNDLDGEIKAAWLLTEIDHWDNEIEKIVILTDTSVIIAKYDFVAEKILRHKRILLHTLHSLYIGELIYPEKSVMPERKHGGIRLAWGDPNNLSFGQKWNPWSSTIPYVTLTHHPLSYSSEFQETVTYSANDFFESLESAVKAAYQRKNPGQQVMVIEGNILVETYASLGSMVFNQSFLGYSRERGGVSF
ncbi:tumor protein p63-regulated gene 1 protein-like [Tubulanus polymorphus]|uniref:tumor protein p63-regulated gene 1 protein-like n=1 Tax=Tubulanus polymorphus TaxID=672921 RepID=UPI003DA3A3C8